MKPTKNTARKGAGEAAALDAPVLLYDWMPLAQGNEANTLLLTAGVLSTDPRADHVSDVLCLNADAQMEQLVAAILLRARAVRGALTLLSSSEAIDEAHRAAADGAGMLVDELLGLAAAVETAVHGYDDAREARA